MDRKCTAILDGYNVIHRVPDLAACLDTSLQTARDALLRFCGRWIARRRDVWQFLVVFDGETDVVGSRTGAPPGVRAVYTRTGETADERIARLLDDAPSPRDCLVVSDDNAVIRNAQACHAAVMSPSRFHAVLRGPREGAAAHPDDEEADRRLSPLERQELNDELRRAWGIE